MTRYLRFGFVVTLVALGSFGAAQEPAHVIVRPDNVTWGPASPKLPGCTVRENVRRLVEAWRTVRVPRQTPRRLPRSTALASEG